MRDDRVEKLADILVDYSCRVRRGDLVGISASYHAEPLMLAIYRRCLDRGAHVALRPSLPHAGPMLYKHASEEQLEFVWEPDRWLAENLDVRFTIIADNNTRQLSRVDPRKQALTSRARKPLMDTFMSRGASGDLRWNVTLFPTEAHAMDAEMSLEEYEDFYYGACLVDADDPVAEWEAVAERHRRMIGWIETRNEIRVEGEGTDLILETGGRKWLPADGKHNFPDGEIFTGPHEDKTRGRVTFSYPAIYGGQAVEGIQLVFEDGKVVEATARKNEEFLLKTLDTDPGARILGEIGIGTNYGIHGFSGEILLDEKIGGTVHLAVGAAYPESGGVNDSAVHWDMVCDLRKGGRITVDGDVFMEDGKLLIS